MKLGVVTTSYPRHPGEPAGCFVAELNQCLLDEGHELEVLAAGAGQWEDSWQSVPVRRIPAASGLFYEGGAPDALTGKRAALSAALFSARMARQVRRRVRGWDGMVAHWLAPSALACALAGRRLPMWAIAHGGDVHLLEKLGLVPAGARLLDRPEVQLSFVSDSVRSTFVSAAGGAGADVLARSRVCPMGIDLGRLQLSRALRSANDKPVICFLGRLIRLKGVDVLLEALSGLERECQVVIAGTGPERAALQARARQLGLEVSWPGEVRGLSRDRLLGSSDVVVVPSRSIAGRSEGMPLVALEALAAGAQLVVSASGGLKEIPASLCHSVSPDEPWPLREALQKVLDGAKAASPPDRWLKSHAWNELGPRLLPGLIHSQGRCRSA